MDVKEGCGRATRAGRPDVSRTRGDSDEDISEVGNSMDDLVAVLDVAAPGTRAHTRPQPARQANWGRNVVSTGAGISLSRTIVTRLGARARGRTVATIGT